MRRGRDAQAADRGEGASGGVVQRFSPQGLSSAPSRIRHVRVHWSRILIGVLLSAVRAAFLMSSTLAAQLPLRARTHRPPHRQCHRRLVLRTPAIGVRDHKTLRPHLDRTGHRTGRLSSPTGQRAQDLVHVLDGEREVSLGGQEPHARAWQRRRLMAAVLRRDHEVFLAVP